MKTSKILCILYISVATCVISNPVQGEPSSVDRARALRAIRNAQHNLELATKSVKQITYKELRQKTTKNVIDLAASNKPDNKTKEAVVVEVIKALKDAEVSEEELKGIIKEKYGPDSSERLDRSKLEATQGFNEMRDFFACISVPAAGVDSEETSDPKSETESEEGEPASESVPAAATAGVLHSSSEVPDPDSKTGTTGAPTDSVPVAGEGASGEVPTVGDVPPPLPERPAPDSETAAEDVPPPLPERPAPGSKTVSTGAPTDSVPVAGEGASGEVPTVGDVPPPLPERPAPDSKTVSTGAPTDSVPVAGADSEGATEKGSAPKSEAAEDSSSSPDLTASITAAQPESEKFKINDAILKDQRNRLRKTHSRTAAQPESEKFKINDAILQDQLNKLRKTGQLEALADSDSLSLVDRDKKLDERFREESNWSRRISKAADGKSDKNNDEDNADVWSDSDDSMSEAAEVPEEPSPSTDQSEKPQEEPSPSTDQSEKPQEDTAKNITCLKNVLKNIIDNKNPPIMYKDYRTGNIDKAQIQDFKDTVYKAFSEANGKGEQAMEKVLEIDWQKLLATPTTNAQESVAKYYTYYVLWNAFINTLWDPLKRVDLSKYCTIDETTGKQKFTPEGEKALSEIVTKITTNVNISDDFNGLNFRGLVSTICEKTGSSKEEIADGLIYMLYKKGLDLSGEKLEDYKTLCNLVFNRYQLQDKFKERYGKGENDAEKQKAYAKYLGNANKLKNATLDKFFPNPSTEDISLTKDDIGERLGIKSRPKDQEISSVPAAVVHIVGPEADIGSWENWMLEYTKFNIITDYHIRQLFIAYIERYGKEELNAISVMENASRDIKRRVNDIRASTQDDNDDDSDNKHDSDPDDWL